MATAWKFLLAALCLLASARLGSAALDVDFNVSVVLDPGDPAATDFTFGSLLALSDDGDILIVRSGNTFPAVLSYARTADGGLALAQILGRGANVIDLALSGDGQVLVLALQPSPNEAFVEVWTAAGAPGSWTRARSPLTTVSFDERSFLDGPHEDAVVATSFDGAVIAVGTPGYNEPAFDGVVEFLYDAGRVRTFRDDGSRTWTAVVSNTISAFPGELERVGTAVAVSKDGRTIVATAPGIGIVTQLPPYGGVLERPFGGAYVFSVSSDGVYVEVGKMRGSGERGDEAGNCRENNCVAIDGDTIAVGAPFGYFGYVDIYVPSPDAFGGYALQATITPLDRDREEDDRFGTVALLGDSCLVGAPSISFRRNPGAVYLFQRLGETWDIEPTVIDPPAELESKDFYGRSLAVTNNVLVVGSVSSAATAADREGRVSVFGTDATNRSFPPTGATTAMPVGFPTTAPSAVFSAAPSPEEPSSAPSSAPSFADNGIVDLDTITIVDAEDLVSAEDNFGTSVAISADGSTLIVGVSAYQPTRRREDGGVFVYARVDESAWSRTQVITKRTLSVNTNEGGYGSRLALSGSGGVLIVGAHDGDGNPAEVWTSSPDDGDFFRFAATVPVERIFGGRGGLAASFDGAIFAIGGVLDNVFEDPGSPSFQRAAGSISVYQDDGSEAWALPILKLIADGPQQDARLGTSVAMSQDGRTVVGGAPGYNVLDPTSGSIQIQQAGAVYVFVIAADGASWTQEALLVSPNAARRDFAGRSVALDGDTLAIGALRVVRAGDPNQAFVDIWTRTGTSWSHETRLDVPNGALGDQFGLVALFDSLLLVGGFAGSRDGAAYFFSRTGSIWSPTPRAIDPNALSVAGSFGVDVALVENFAVVGASLADVGSATDAGAAVVFGTAPFMPPFIAEPSAAPSVNDKCAAGIINENVCCAAECGVCGGCDCALLGTTTFGGAAFCCPDTIRFNDVACIASMDVGCVLRTVLPPAPRPRTGTECRE